MNTIDITIKAMREARIDLVKMMYGFVNKYSAKGEFCIYPEAERILAIVLRDRLEDLEGKLNREDIKEKAKQELKEKISCVMYDFSNKYSTKGENCLYPKTDHLIFSALHELLECVKKQLEKD